MGRDEILRFKLCVFIWAISFLLCGCSNTDKMEPSYAFPHSVEDIESIDLLLNNNVDAFSSDQDAFALLRRLDESDISLFMNAVYELETSYCISPPLRGYGTYVAKVTYSNGDVEMLGSEHIEFIRAGSDPTGVGAYYFTEDAFEKLVLSYLSSDYSE